MRQKLSTIPTPLFDRLSKATGHINAVERWLWQDRPRGLWSARQAKARYAEIQLSLAGRLDALPAVEPKLPSDLVEERIAATAALSADDAVAAAWSSLIQAEAEILAQPFPDAAACLDRAVLRAGLDRKHAYLDALRAVGKALVAQLLSRYPPLPQGEPGVDEVSDFVQASPTIELFQDLHRDSAIPDPAMKAHRIAAEIGDTLNRSAEEDCLLYRSSRPLADAEVRDALGRSDGAVPFAESRPPEFASLLTSAGEGGPARDLIEVAGHWDEQACLAALRRLRRLLMGDVGAGTARLRLAGLYICHSHDARQGDPDVYDWEGESPSLRDRIEASISGAFADVGCVSPAGPNLGLRIEGYEMGGWALWPESADGAMTCMFAWFCVAPQKPGKGLAAVRIPQLVG